MRFYIAGPMRGYKDFNFPAFHAAAKVLREGYHKVVSPAEMDEEEYGSYKEIEAQVSKPNSLRGFMARDLPAMLSCDGVALLPGWAESQGALIEAFVAEMCGLKVFEYMESAFDGRSVSTARLLLAIGQKVLKMNISLSKGDTK